MRRSLKFCHFSTFYPPYSFGGDAIFLYRLVNSLAAQGHEVDVIHCADSYNLLAEKPTVTLWLHHPKVTVHTLHSRWGPLSPFLSQQTGRPWLKTKMIRQILHNKKFNVIHYHNISLFGPKVLEISPDYSGFIKLYTTHEYWLICPMHVLWRNNKRLCDRPCCFFCTLMFHRPPQWWRYTSLLRKTTESVDQFISPSWFAIDMHHRRGFKKPFVQLPHYTLPPGIKANKTEASPNTRPFFLFVGRLERIKGLQDVISVFSSYKQADLLIAGDGRYKPELQHLAQGLDHVKFLGWSPTDRLTELYRKAIALVLPSICYEVFPLVLFEAFSNGTPAIVRVIGSLPEIIDECRGGLTYRSREELLSAMERLCADEDLQRRLGHNACQAWKEMWTEQAHLNRYFDILNQTAKRKYGFVPWAAKAVDPHP